MSDLGSDFLQDPVREYTVLFAFCGIGGGALGFLQAETRLFGTRARFRSLGGIDQDPQACADFEYLTKSPAFCIDIATLTAAQLRAWFGHVAPDVIFLSPPCKGSSGLISNKKAKTAKYTAMNELAVVWTRLMLEAWPDAPPKLVLLENVPRIKSRAAAMLRKVRSMLHQAGYLSRDGFHDCGELGGLAQHRRRYLLVARHQKSVPPLLFQPPRKRVRSVGELLEHVPLPNDPAGGPMHQMPRISWLNWVRLALIPPGGDWRDLPDVLADGEARRTKFRRHLVASWNHPNATVGGSGSNGAENVADPRPKGWFKHVLRVVPWNEPVGTITGAHSPSNGAATVADVRMGAYFKGAMGVRSWDEACGTVTGESLPQNGAFSVADPRVSRAFDHAYGVLDWREASPTVAGKSAVGCGAYAVADFRWVSLPLDASLKCAPRATAYGVLGWEEAACTITSAGQIDNGAFAVADPRVPDAPPAFVVRDVRRPPEGAVPVIIAKDGSWHRPLTPYELALFQGLPAVVDGKPLCLAGDSTTAWRERIGAAVPPAAGQAIAERMLSTLLQADTEGFALSGDAEVWVEPNERGMLA